ncbi:hypothetical protein WUBG_07740, partial [Wuchereria bancrofti]
MSFSNCFSEFLKFDVIVSYLSTKANCLGLCHFTVTLFVCLFFFSQVLKFVFCKNCFSIKRYFG